MSRQSRTKTRTRQGHASSVSPTVVANRGTETEATTALSESAGPIPAGQMPLILQPEVSFESTGSDSDSGSSSNSEPGSSNLFDSATPSPSLSESTIAQELTTINSLAASGSASRSGPEPGFGVVHANNREFVNQLASVADESKLPTHFVRIQSSSSSNSRKRRATNQFVPFQLSQPIQVDPETGIWSIPADSPDNQPGFVWVRLIRDPRISQQQLPFSTLIQVPQDHFESSIRAEIDSVQPVILQLYRNTHVQWQGAGSVPTTFPHIAVREQISDTLLNRLLSFQPEHSTGIIPVVVLPQQVLPKRHAMSRFSMQAPKYTMSEMKQEHRQFLETSQQIKALHEERVQLSQTLSATLHQLHTLQASKTGVKDIPRIQKLKHQAANLTLQLRRLADTISEAHQSSDTLREHKKRLKTLSGAVKKHADMVAKAQHTWVESSLPANRKRPRSVVDDLDKREQAQESLAFQVDLLDTLLKPHLDTEPGDVFFLGQGNLILQALQTEFERDPQVLKRWLNRHIQKHPNVIQWVKRISEIWDQDSELDRLIESKSESESESESDESDVAFTLEPTEPGVKLTLDWAQCDLCQQFRVVHGPTNSQAPFYCGSGILQGGMDLSGLPATYQDRAHLFQSLERESPDIPTLYLEPESTNATVLQMRQLRPYLCTMAEETEEQADTRLRPFLTTVDSNQPLLRRHRLAALASDYRKWRRWFEETQETQKSEESEESEKSQKSKTTKPNQMMVAFQQFEAAFQALQNAAAKDSTLMSRDAITALINAEVDALQFAKFYSNLSTPFVLTETAQDTKETEEDSANSDEDMLRQRQRALVHHKKKAKKRAKQRAKASEASPSQRSKSRSKLNHEPEPEPEPADMTTDDVPDEISTESHPEDTEMTPVDTTEEFEEEKKQLEAEKAEEEATEEQEEQEEQEDEKAEEEEAEETKETEPEKIEESEKDLEDAEALEFKQFSRFVNSARAKTQATQVKTVNQQIDVLNEANQLARGTTIDGLLRQMLKSRKPLTADVDKMELDEIAHQLDYSNKASANATLCRGFKRYHQFLGTETSLFAPVVHLLPKCAFYIARPQVPTLASIANVISHLRTLGLTPEQEPLVQARLTETWQENQMLPLVFGGMLRMIALHWLSHSSKVDPNILQDELAQHWPNAERRVIDQVVDWMRRVTPSADTQMSARQSFLRAVIRASERWVARDAALPANFRWLIQQFPPVDPVDSVQGPVDSVNPIDSVQDLTAASAPQLPLPLPPSVSIPTITSESVPVASESVSCGSGSGTCALSGTFPQPSLPKPNVFVIQLQNYSKRHQINTSNLQGDPRWIVAMIGFALKIKTVVVKFTGQPHSKILLQPIVDLLVANQQRVPFSSYAAATASRVAMIRDIARQVFQNNRITPDQVSEAANELIDMAFTQTLEGDFVAN